MANVRMTGKREEFNALWAQANALTADLTAVRAALIALGADATGMGGALPDLIGPLIQGLLGVQSGLTALTAKLDLDPDITATNFASTCDPDPLYVDPTSPTFTFEDPAALTAATTTLVAP